MVKYNLIILIIGIFIISCAPSIDTTGMSPEEKLKVAKLKFDNRDFDEALNELQALILQNRASAIADDAQYYIGLCRFERKEYILASNEFSILIRDYPTSPLVKDAQLMLANSYYELSPNYSLDQRFTKKAIEEYQLFIDFFPTDSRVQEASEKIKILNDKLAEKIFRSAVIYSKMEYNKSSLIYFDLLLEKYPDSKFAPETLLKKAEILIDKKRNKEAYESIEKFLSKFPGHPLTRDILKLKEKISTPM